MLTIAHLDQATNDDRWNGFGYLGGREIAAQQDAAAVATIDALVIAEANRLGWTYEDLFAWANSRHGRYAADALFSGSTIAQVVRWNLITLDGLR